MDVVPSAWHDTYAYQASKLQEDREVRILDHRQGVTLINCPFKHMAEIERKCIAHSGIRKIIRALKNLRYDASPQIDLSSFDIAAIVWNMLSNSLSVGYLQPLLLLDAARSDLAIILTNSDYPDSLKVPDGTRKIFNEPGKFDGALRLYRELNALLEDVASSTVAIGVVTEQVKKAALQKQIQL